MPSHKILIVDDNSDFRQMMRYQLEMWGFEVLEAEAGSPGLQIAMESSPDLILLDYHMPDMDGVQVAKAAQAARPDLPVLFLTADFEISFLRDLNAAHTSVVQKPFDIDDLRENINHLLH
jgi:CheY-like chemotaxis protein